MYPCVLAVHVVMGLSSASSREASTTKPLSFEMHFPSPQSPQAPLYAILPPWDESLVDNSDEALPCKLTGLYVPYVEQLCSNKP